MSTNRPTQPGYETLSVTIVEQHTGNTVTINPYQCPKGHSPTLQELLLFLLDQSERYVQAITDKVPDQLILNACDFTQTTLKQGRDCFQALCTLFKNTGIPLQELEQAVRSGELFNKGMCNDG
ncbi:MAG: hypothetical protein RLP14_01980 [Owenweeksia sp.]